MTELKCRHEPWAVLIRECLPNMPVPAWAVERALEYVAELEAEPTIEDWLNDNSIMPALTFHEVEGWIEEFRGYDVTFQSLVTYLGERLLTWFEDQQPKSTASEASD